MMAQNFFNRFVPALTALLWSIGLFQVLDSDHLSTKLAILVVLPVVTGVLLARSSARQPHQTVKISIPLK